jgi:hypothetical protein
MHRLKTYLSSRDDLGTIPVTSPLYKLYFDRLRIYLLDLYISPLPLIDQIRARRELRLVRSIRRKLVKYKLLLRQTDKSGVLHIGHACDYERKAAKYRQETGAYEELQENPFSDIIVNATHLLNQMQATKKISEAQRLKMTPTRHKTHLAYMYFLPKPHKVIFHRIAE